MRQSPPLAAGFFQLVAQLVDLPAGVTERTFKFKLHKGLNHNSPIKIAVDFHIEAREGSTVVRVVQSGFSAGAEWDDMFDAIRDGWTYFMFNLVFWFEYHRGRTRRMAWKRVATDLGRDLTWQAIASP